MNWLMSRAVSKKGMASPAEYTARRRTPRAIVSLAAASDTIARGVLLLAVYSAGLAIPFLLTALLISQFMTFYKNFRKYLHAVEVLSGALLLCEIGRASCREREYV